LPSGRFISWSPHFGRDGGLSARLKPILLLMSSVEMRFHVLHQMFLDGNKLSLYIADLSGTIMFVASQHLMRKPFPCSI
jgi:hypothetical protein